MTVRMNNKTLLWLAIVAIVALIAYGAFSHYSVSEIDDEPSTNSSVESESIAKNNTGNVTNQSTMAIPLEKPPFID